MSSQTPGQLRAFASACYAKNINESEARANAEAIAGKPFSDFTYEETNHAIQRINAIESKPALSEFEVSQEERRLRNAFEDQEADRALVEKNIASFGEDFETVIAPIMYSLWRPANPKWFIPYNQLRELPTLEERRSGLFALMAKSFASFEFNEDEIRPSAFLEIGSLTG